MIAYTEEEIYTLLDNVNCIRDTKELFDYMKEHKYHYSYDAWMKLNGTVKLFEDLFKK